MDTRDNRPPLDWDNFSPPSKKQKKKQPEYPLKTPCLALGLFLGLIVAAITHNFLFGTGLGMLLGLIAGRLFPAK